jgi:hypothetical protein
MHGLWQALLHPKNPRGHPILAALAYAFCPAAARWWMAGAVPDPAPAPVREALADMAAGKTLREALTERGFAPVLEEAPRYVRAVEAFRRAHPGIRAPERSEFFLEAYDRLPLAKRFGLTEAVRPLGGWEGFYEYLRAFAFLIEDWGHGMGFRSPAVEAAELAISLPGIRRPAYFPAFVFVEGPREVIGALSEDGGQDLRLPLFVRADRADGRWRGRPEVWVLSPDGEARPYRPWIADEALPDLVGDLARAAREGPWPPLRALRSGGTGCAGCGFRGLCWPDGDQLQPPAFRGQKTRQAEAVAP